jgi:hypothetical protein
MTSGVFSAAMPPPVAEYSGLQAAYEHFNAELFNGELPDVMIVLTRRAHSFGHFSADRFAAREGGAQHHELSLNPDGFFGRGDKEVLSKSTRWFTSCMRYATRRRSAITTTKISPRK